MFLDFRPEISYSSFFLDADWYRLVFAFIGLCLFLAVSTIQEKKGSVSSYLGQKPLVLRWGIYLAVLGLLVYAGNFDIVVTGGFEYAQF